MTPEQYRAVYPGLRPLTDTQLTDLDRIGQFTMERGQKLSFEWAGNGPHYFLGDSLFVVADEGVYEFCTCRENAPSYFQDLTGTPTTTEKPA